MDCTNHDLVGVRYDCDRRYSFAVRLIAARKGNDRDRWRQVTTKSDERARINQKGSEKPFQR
jgi:hypothetical protein